MTDQVFLLGVPIAALRQTEAVARIMSLLQSAQQSHVMTPNSEMLVLSAQDQSFCQLLQRSALNLPDSVGLLKMAKRTGQQLPERVTGVDTVRLLCAQLQPDQPVFLLGAADGVADRAAVILKQANPQLNIAGTYAGSPADADAPAIISQINSSGAHLLLVAYGAPGQDFWIDQHRSQMPKVRVAMGVGGTFDFIAGDIKRAPRFIQSLGLEWLWRLLLEPSRLPRIINATVRFPWLVRKHGRGACRDA